MNAYTQTIQAGQEALDTVNILELADPICSVAEWNAFQARLFREPQADTHRRNAICIAFQCGAIGAIEALHMLAADELYGDPDYFMAAYSAGVATLSQLTPPVSPVIELAARQHAPAGEAR